MEDQPDLTFYFRIHQAQREASLATSRPSRHSTEPERSDRGAALRRWAKGFVLELEEHHFVEDTFFFPSLRSKVASAAAHARRPRVRTPSPRRLLSRVAGDRPGLADPNVPFGDSRAAAVAFAERAAHLPGGHLASEDQDVLPLFWRHYTAAEYDAVVDRP